MQAAGWDVKFVAWSRGGPAEEELRTSGISTRILGDGLVRNVVKLRGIILDFKPHIVHTALARPSIGAALTRLCMRRGIKWIASDHGVHEWHEKGAIRGQIMDAVMPRILSRMDAVLSVSESAANELIRHGVNPERVRVVPNGINTSRFYPGQTRDRKQFLATQFPQDNPAKNYFVIGSAGNLRKLKGYEDLVEAMPQIIAATPNARCLVWGEGPERKPLIARTQELGLSHAISFCGHADAMEKRLPMLDLYVQPSRLESFGMAAAEAMACGVPVVVSDTGGLKELVQDRVNGQIFPAGDAAALADHVLNLAGDEATRARLGQAGRQRIEKDFSQKRMENVMREIYEELYRADESA